MAIATDRKELGRVEAELSTLIAAGDTEGLARWAQKQGPGLLLIARNPQTPTGAAESPEATGLGAKFVAGVRSGAIGEGAFRLAVAKLAKGVHGPLVSLVAKWLSKEGKLDNKTYKAIVKALSSKIGVSVLAFALSKLLEPLSVRDGKANALAPIAAELKVFAAYNGIEEGANAAIDGLKTYGPMLLEAVLGAESPEAALAAAGEAVTKLRVVADALPVPAEEVLEEARGQKEVLRASRRRG